MNFTKQFTLANLAKVFRFTFAKWILPSPLAKCEGLCASLHNDGLCPKFSAYCWPILTLLMSKLYIEQSIILESELVKGKFLNSILLDMPYI